jgi:hypothetical protein
MKQRKTLARSSTLKHKTGIPIKTPLLVPSFSSKGFYKNSKGISEIDEIYDIALESITDSMLISAYDIYYENIKTPNYEVPLITIVDSGGYEISDDDDLSAIKYTKNRQKEWTEDKLSQVYKSIPTVYPIILVSYDHPKKRIVVKEQIKEAESFFQNFPSHLHTLLIKPETENQKYVQIESVLDSINALAKFDIIGFTEKELGGSILKRMMAISTIRRNLDNAKLQLPIHIYGSLDPITSILYFISGAEIFDGLTWIRYGFLNGNACYYNNFGARTCGIDIDNNRTKKYMLSNNLIYLNKIKNQMEKFLVNEDFSVFDREDKLSKLIESSNDLLRSRDGRIK